MEAIMRQSSKDGAETASGTTPKHTGKPKRWSVTDVPHQQRLKIMETHTSLASDVWSCFLQNQCTKSQPTQMSPEEPKFQTKRAQCFSCTDFWGVGGGGGGSKYTTSGKLYPNPYSCWLIQLVWHLSERGVLGSLYCLIFSWSSKIQKPGEYNSNSTLCVCVCVCVCVCTSLARSYA